MQYQPSNLTQYSEAGETEEELATVTTILTEAMEGHLRDEQFDSLSTKMPSSPGGTTGRGWGSPATPFIAAACNTNTHLILALYVGYIKDFTNEQLFSLMSQRAPSYEKNVLFMAMRQVSFTLEKLKALLPILKRLSATQLNELLDDGESIDTITTDSLDRVNCMTMLASGLVNHEGLSVSERAMVIPLLFSVMPFETCIFFFKYKMKIGKYVCADKYEEKKFLQLAKSIKQQYKAEGEISFSELNDTTGDYSHTSNLHEAKVKKRGSPGVLECYINKRNEFSTFLRAAILFNQALRNEAAQITTKFDQMDIELLVYILKFLKPKNDRFFIQSDMKVAKINLFSITPDKKHTPIQLKGLSKQTEQPIIMIDHGGVLECIRGAESKEDLLLNELWENAYYVLPGGAKTIRVLNHLVALGAILVFHSKNFEEHQIKLLKDIDKALIKHAQVTGEKLSMPVFSAMVVAIDNTADAGITDTADNPKVNESKYKKIPVLKYRSDPQNDRGKREVREAIKAHFKIQHPHNHYVLDDGPSNCFTAEQEGYNAYLINGETSTLTALQAIKEKLQAKQPTKQNEEEKTRDTGPLLGKNAAADGPYYNLFFSKGTTKAAGISLLAGGGTTAALFFTGTVTSLATASGIGAIVALVLFALSMAARMVRNPDTKPRCLSGQETSRPHLS